MKANVGDRLLVESRSSEQHRQEGEIIEVQGSDGQPPFLVRWTDGHGLCAIRVRTRRVRPRRRARPEHVRVDYRSA